jgi:sugar transferase (PEP-CTERM/EpsH1 system associated)
VPVLAGPHGRFVAPRVPWPLDTGAKIRTYHMLLGLARAHRVRALLFADSAAERAAGASLGSTGAEIEIVARDTPPLQRLRDAAGGLLGPAPYNIRKYQRETMARAVLRTCEARRPDLVHCDHLHLACYGELVARRHRVPHSIDEHNVESLIFRRFVARAHGPLRIAFWQQSVWLRRYEARAARRAWGCLVCSREDAENLRGLSGQTNLCVTPNGVALDTFGEAVAPEVKGHLVLTGSMDWAPNEDGALWFHEQVLPAILEAEPNLRFYLVGRNPGPKLTALAGRRNTQVTGTVPDIRPFLAGARCLVVPLRVGGGTRLKILEAFAARVPVVSTRVGAEGIMARDGEELLFAETPDDFARAVGRLGQDPVLADRLRANARTLAERAYGWEAIAAGAAEFYRTAPRTV